MIQMCHIQQIRKVNEYVGSKKSHSSPRDSHRVIASSRAQTFFLDIMLDRDNPILKYRDI